MCWFPYGTQINKATCNVLIINYSYFLNNFGLLLIGHWASFAVQPFHAAPVPNQILRTSKTNFSNFKTYLIILLVSTVGYATADLTCKQLSASLKCNEMINIQDRDIKDQTITMLHKPQNPNTERARVLRHESGEISRLDQGK